MARGHGRKHILAVSASNERLEKRLVTCRSMFDYNADDCFVGDWERLCGQDAVIQTPELYCMIEVVSVRASELGCINWTCLL